jgi:hypothetical protein
MYPFMASYNQSRDLDPMPGDFTKGAASRKVR